ncbi:hypothetical protein G3M81_12585 [Bacillus paralicheniformis]|uniref:hypothetical protein n=1 Tax=Bacillus TaxID=1386 RepID=UPI0013EF11C0|nr:MULTISPECIES: hypothetical protein [Bacillus]MCY8609941.1 hypothetical protein [Bacillus haynesii]MEC0752176.1 hypothetical protein [Bacillus haynesii]QII49525.1 hypothetical protein G3M81_12585 [Bacillus paralicheniformis]
MKQVSQTLRQERIFASKLCKASQVTDVCRKAKALFATGSADDFIVANGLILQLAGPRSRKFLEMEAAALVGNPKDTN